MKPFRTVDQVMTDLKKSLATQNEYLYDVKAITSVEYRVGSISDRSLGHYNITLLVGWYAERKQDTISGQKCATGTEWLMLSMSFGDFMLALFEIHKLSESIRKKRILQRKFD